MNKSCWHVSDRKTSPFFDAFDNFNQVARYKGIGEKAERSQSLKELVITFVLWWEAWGHQEAWFSLQIYIILLVIKLLWQVLLMYLLSFLSSHQAAMPLLLTFLPTDIYSSSHIYNTAEDCTFYFHVQSNISMPHSFELLKQKLYLIQEIFVL